MAGHASHGHTLDQKKSPTYQSWKGMIQRCTNPKAQGYQHYGGKGVTVCERWRRFANFLEDMGERPSKGHSIDRKQSSGNYEPANCQWSTSIEQHRNTSRNKMLTHEGQTMPLSAWAELKGISASTLWNRLAEDWSIERALTTPAGKYVRRSTGSDPSA